VIWEEWWFWVVGGMAIAILELFLPGYLFVGFALGAVATGLITLVGVWPAGWMAGSLPNHLLVLAILSIVIWLALRKLLGIRQGQVKTFDRDINED
jgi:inner membrane protein